MASDKTLFHSFWWTHYVTFCALAVVYVWGIQLAKQPSYQSNDEFYSRLFDLAEKCRVHLRQATAGLSPNRRYDVILEELRREAHNSYNNTSDAAYQNRESLQPGDAGNNPDFHETFFNELPARESDESGFLENTHNEGVPSVFGFEGAFQFSDWLTLDSSVCIAVKRISFLLLTNYFQKAFFPVSDPNSVSPPWLSAIP